MNVFEVRLHISIKWCLIQSSGFIKKEEFNIFPTCVVNNWLQITDFFSRAYINTYIYSSKSAAAKSFDLFILWN